MHLHKVYTVMLCCKTEHYCCVGIIVVRCVISCSDQLSFCAMPVESSRLVEELHKLVVSPVATPILK